MGPFSFLTQEQIRVYWVGRDFETDGDQAFDLKMGSKTLNAWVVALSLDNEKRFIFFTEDGMVFRSNETGVLK